MNMPEVFRGLFTPKQIKLIESFQKHKKELRSVDIKTAIRPSTHHWLKERADERGITINELVSEALEDYIVSQQGVAL